MRTSTDQNGPAERISQLLAQRIRTAREGAEITRQQLADRITALGIKVTVHAVSQWENAVAIPRWATSVAIAQSIGVAWSTIFNLDEVQL